MRCLRQFQRCGVNGVAEKMPDTFPESSEREGRHRGPPTILELSNWVEA